MDPEKREYVLRALLLTLQGMEGGALESEVLHADSSWDRVEGRFAPNPLSMVKVRVSGEQRKMLDLPFSVKEMEIALFQMDGLKAPGSDGYAAVFYQKNWDWIGGK